MELARVRLRGVYAVVAAVTLLLAAPLYQGVALGPAYVAAVTAIAARRDFAPYLAWLGGALTEDRVFRLLQIAPLALALTLPGALCAALWPTAPRGRAWRVALLSGWAGFSLWVIAGAVGLLQSGRAAVTYAAASPAARVGVAQGFGQSYALQALLSRGLAAVLIAVFIGLASLRQSQGGLLPRWPAYLGAIAAALLAANAVLTLLDPLNVGTPAASLSSVALAVWLFVSGLGLAQLRLPAPAPATPGAGK